MFSRNVFLYGFGAGLICGAVLLQLMVAAGRESAKPAAASAASPTPGWNVQQAEALAEQNGYKLYRKDDKLYTENELQARIRQQSAGANTPAATSAPAATTDAVNVYISEGNTSEEIAELLAQAGVIKDAAAFEQLLKQRRLDTKINRGRFLLSPDESVETILSKIMIRNP